jgi:hypothetical protein
MEPDGRGHEKGWRESMELKGRVRKGREMRKEEGKEAGSGPEEGESKEERERRKEKGKKAWRGKAEERRQKGSKEERKEERERRTEGGIKKSKVKRRKDEKGKKKEEEEEREKEEYKYIIKSEKIIPEAKKIKSRTLSKCLQHNLLFFLLFLNQKYLPCVYQRWPLGISLAGSFKSNNFCQISNFDFCDFHKQRIMSHLKTL